MQNIINIIVFLLILGSIIIIHELGHFLSAKYFGVYCGQFSIGFGPKIWSKKGKETEYEIRALPFGGFVAMAGEEDQLDNEDMKNVPIERTLKGIKTYQKIIIYLAGVFMNFVLAIVIMLGLNLTSGQLPVNVAQVGKIIEDSPAEKYGLQEGDIIEKIFIAETNQKILVANYTDIKIEVPKENIPQEIHMTMNVDRAGVDTEIKLIVPYDGMNAKYTIGITQATRSMTFVEAFQYTFISLAEMSMMIFTAIGQLITKFSQTIGQMSGPAGIYQMTAEITETGQISYLLSFLAMLSVNIGIFNLMPIPGLDGCQVLFSIVEKIIGRELPQKLKIVLQLIGLGLVVLLMIIVTYQDILRMLG